MQFQSPIGETERGGKRRDNRVTSAPEEGVKKSDKAILGKGSVTRKCKR